jgi:hypothetical protein
LRRAINSKPSNPRPVRARIAGGRVEFAVSVPANGSLTKSALLAIGLIALLARLEFHKVGTREYTPSPGWDLAD